MANSNAPFGLRPVRHYSGGCVRANAYQIAGGYTSNIFRGDPVKSVGTNKRIAVAAATNTMRGVFDGCEYVDTNGEIKFSHHWPANQAIKTGSVVTAFVWDDPMILFEAQMSLLFAETDIGNVADLTFATAGSTLTGNSGCAVDSAALGSAGISIIDYVREASNVVGNYTRVLIMLNEHELGHGAMTGV